MGNNIYQTGKLCTMGRAWCRRMNMRVMFSNFLKVEVKTNLSETLAAY